MSWRTFAGLCCVVLVLSACGGAAAAPPTAEPVAGAPTSVPSATRGPSASPAVATASPAPAARPTATTTTETQAATQASTVWVGNTDGEGVYIRKTPAMADRIKAYADGTPLTIVGDDVDGDGQHWKHVKTPDGIEGYVPALYTLDTQP